MPRIDDIAISVILLLLLIGAYIAIKTTTKPRVRTGGYIVIYAVMAFCITGLVFSQIARTHGATNESLNRISWYEVITHTLNTPKESEIKDLNNLSDCYIIYYKFTCPDCTGTYRELQQWLNAHPPDANLYYVAADSKNGMELRQNFPVDTVPSMIYIYPNGRTFLAKQIYTTEADGTPHLLPEGLDKVYDARKDLIQQ